LRPAGDGPRSGPDPDPGRSGDLRPQATLVVPVLRIALRDLQWRRRRFAFTTLGVAVVFGLTLVITGVSTGFLSEANNTVNEMGASAWVVRKGADGPFLGSSPFSDKTVGLVRNLPGIDRAVDTVYTHRDVVSGGRVVSVNVFGAPTGDLGMPVPSAGRQPTDIHQIMISTKLKGFPIGSHLLLAAHPFTVVGQVDNSTALAGTPNVFLTLAGAQLVAFNGLPVASAVAIRGSTPPRLPDGLAVVSNAAARDDLLRALGSARSSITLIAFLLWLVAALIVGSIIYVSVLERQREFAVFKATGMSTQSILGSLSAQAIALSLVAALIGVVISIFIKPLFPLPVTLTTNAFLLLPLIAVLVGLLASFVGLRKAVSVEPALAFAGP
jgi:putative ABC transport system permease protein